MSTDEMAGSAVLFGVMASIVVWFFGEIRRSRENNLDETDIPTPPTIEELQAMTKAELLAYAEANGIETRTRWTKSQLIDSILLQL